MERALYVDITHTAAALSPAPSFHTFQGTRYATAVVFGLRNAVFIRILVARLILEAGASLAEHACVTAMCTNTTIERRLVSINSLSRARPLLAGCMSSRTNSKPYRAPASRPSRDSKPREALGGGPYVPSAASGDSLCGIWVVANSKGDMSSLGEFPGAALRRPLLIQRLEYVPAALGALLV
jgi:hypothetical protein